MMTVVLMSTVQNVNQMHIIINTIIIVTTQIQECVGMLVSPHAAVMTQVLDCATSTLEMLTTVDVPAM